MVDLVNLIRAFAFGPFLVLGFLAGTFVFWKKGKEESYDENQILDAVILSSFWGLVGARAGFILQHIQEFGFDIIKWISVFSFPGYIGITGVILGFLMLYLHARKLKWDTFEILDFGVIGVSLATLFVTLGMFANGSAFGNPTDLPIGLPFPGVFDRRHPAQLYAFALYFLLFMTLWRLEGVYRTYLWYRENRRTAQTGFLFSVFWIGYGVIGLLLSLVQQASIAIFAFPVDPIVYAIAIVFGITMLYIRSGRTISFNAPWAKKKTAVATPEEPVVG